MSKMKYFIILITVILMSLTICAAADDNITQTDTQSIVYEIESNNDDIILQENYDSNINDIQKEDIKTDKIVQKKSTLSSKCDEGYIVTVITEENYNDYLTVSGGQVTLKTDFFVPGNNYTINLSYFPSDVNRFEVSNFYSSDYADDSIKIVGNGITIEDTNIVLDKASLNSIILEDFVLNYNPDYEGDYVDVTSVTLNGVTINVDTQRESLAIPLTINGENTLVENCTINANLPSTQIPWEMDPEILEIPQGTGILITAKNVTFANNVIQITESAILDYGYYKSIYGIYSSGNYTTFRNNTIVVTGTQYMYGVVLRSSSNILSDNHIIVASEYYAAGVNVEGMAIKNNLIFNNYIDVSAGYDKTNMDNYEVAYGCLILDHSCYGENYVASSRSFYNNSYINNIVNVDARQVYGFELWGGVNNSVCDNTMTLTGIFPMGIGAIGINTTMDNNMILVEGTSNGSELSVDYFSPRTAGIYANGMKIGDRISNNTIYVSNGRAILMEKAKNLPVENNHLITVDYAYVIEVDDINNTFKYNAIQGEGTTEEVIKDTTDNKNIYINNRGPLGSQLSIDVKDRAILNKPIDIIILLEDENGDSIKDHYVQVQIGENNIQTFTTDNDGKIELTFTPTTKGTITITAIYDCYEGYGSNTTKDIIVGKTDTTIVINTINQITYNDNIIITGTLKDVDNQPITDDLLISFNNEEIPVTTDIDGRFNFSVIASIVGTNNITVSYAGNDSYNPTSANTTFQVVAKDTIIAVDDIEDVVYLDNVTVSGLLTDVDNQPLVDDLVVLFNGVEHIVSSDDEGMFMFRVIANVIGTNNVTVSYLGNDEYNSATTSTTFQVVAKDTVISLDEIGDVEYADYVSITGKFETSSGVVLKTSTVTLTINGVKVSAKTDNGGVFTYDYKTKSVGINNVTVSYAGNAKYNPTSTSATFQVVAKDTLITIDEIEDTPYTDYATITGTFKTTNGVALKNSVVSITINGVKYSVRTDNNGVFTYSYKTNTAQTNNVTVSYGGNSKYNPTNTTATFMVTPKETVLTIDEIAQTQLNDTAVISGTFKTISGVVLKSSKVTLNINGAKVSVKTDNNGAFTYNYKTKTVGTNNVTVSYGGNTRYAATSTNTTFTVVKQ